MTAIGRKRPVFMLILVMLERPLWRKADIQTGAIEKCIGLAKEIGAFGVRG
jgi:hypothetical protein